MERRRCRSHPRRNLLQCRTPDEGGISLFPLCSRLVVQQPSTWSPSSHILVAGRPTGPISYNYLFYFYIPTCPETLRWVRPAMRHSLPFHEFELKRPSPQQSGSRPQPIPDAMPAERIRRLANRKVSLAPWATGHCVISPASGLRRTLQRHRRA